MAPTDTDPTLDQQQPIDRRLKAIAYSLDCLIPGLYLWLGPLKLRLGGSPAEETYPGTIALWGLPWWHRGSQQV
ncbi:hypothetical protein [Thermoleptolyngbya sp. C42_A2020_037]|uniref:hypothetical protein n=1 Tax=Thermoleptolyngbya sp. C42_A2020_037 TaxID=2747799 RepID=UPI0019E8302E|nr:hypothetical protein [Thermoleptolyngbya sp. C42_A2020_037]MBF2083071.1 hypothetical protein [Thermoleptolyngbya sp. C42_A2020_037]